MSKNSKNRNSYVGWPERIGFGAGFCGTSMTDMVISSYLMIYMTNVALLDIAVVSSIMALSRVLDGISDLIIGSVVDHTSSRLGRARIWLLRMCIPFAVSMMLLFRMPPNIPSFAKYIYLFLFYNMTTAVCITFMSISSLSMVSLMTPDRDEKGVLGNILAASRTFGILLQSYFFVKLLAFFSDDPNNPNTQKSYTLALLVVCAVMVILNLGTVILTRERVDTPDSSVIKNRYSFRQKLAEFRLLVSNKYWLILFICNILMHIGLQLGIAGGSYYALYVLGDMSNFSWLATSLTFASFISMLVFVPFLMQRYGKSKLFIAGLILFVAGSVCFALSAPAKSPMLVFNVIRGFGYGMSASVNVGITADIITDIKGNTGRLVAGIGNAGINTAQKLGAGMSSVIFGFGMALTGFDGARDIQPASAISAVSTIYIWIPAALFAAALLIFLFSFDLERKKK